MTRRTFPRVFLGCVGLSIIAVAAFTIYTLGLARNLSRDALVRGLQGAAFTARAAAEPIMARGRTADLDSLVSAMGREGGIRFTVIDAQGVVLADSQEDPSNMENHALRPEVASALRGERGVSLRLSGTLRQWMLDVAVPAAAGQGVIRAAAYPVELAAASGRALASLAVFAPFILLVCLLLAFLLSRSITAPLSDLAGVVARFAAGDFGARLHLRRRGEIRDLADTFNAMGERVQDLFQERTRRTQELDSIFSSVQQGIVVLDREGRIVRSNRGFEALANVLPVEGKTLWEVVRAPRLTEMVQSARVTGMRQSEEVVIDERTVLCAVERMEDREELILLLSDTTDVHRLETVKRDFVVNASHELRTPLTSIAGSLEILEGEVSGEAARWVRAIRRNADRMTAIVQDMLLLSRLEARGLESPSDSVDLRRIAEDVTGMFAPRARSQQIELRLDCDPALPSIAGDSFLLEQMLVNLVDNALKYTEKGAVDVRCVREDAGTVRLEVADTGIGIAEESLPRIFERFFVVDKSRSRKMGGTGLGLAIVKHIVGSHAGHIAVESTPGKGSRFIVRLPVGRRLTEN